MPALLIPAKHPHHVYNLRAAAIISNVLMTLLASATVGWLWDYQHTGVLVLPEVEEDRETA